MRSCLRRIEACCFAMVAAFLFTSCSGGGGNSPTAPSPTPTPAETPATLGTRTPWSDLPPLSAEAKAVIWEYNVNTLPVWTKKYPSPTITVSAESIDRSVVAEVIDFLNRETVLDLTLTEPGSGGKITISGVWPPQPVSIPQNLLTCYYFDYRHLRGEIFVGLLHLNIASYDAGRCGGTMKAFTARMIIKYVGLFSYPTSTSDVMLGSTWRLSPLLTEIINWLYSPMVKPGIVPVD